MVIATFEGSSISRSFDIIVEEMLDPLNLIGASNSADGLFIIDSMTGETSASTRLDYQYDTPTSGSHRAMARHPGTGVFYVLTGRTNSWPILATLDPDDGTLSPIAAIGESKTPGTSVSITFGPAPDYTLYLITGGSPGKIYSIDIRTGAATPTEWVTQGSGAHAIQYHRDNGELYHFYGVEGGGSPGLESIDLNTGVATAIPLTGDLYNKASGLAYLNGLLYLVDADSNVLHSVTESGVVTAMWTVSDSLRTLAADSTSLYGAADGSNAALHQIDPNTGAYTDTTILGPKPQFRDLDTIARNPATGILYGLTDADYPNSGVQLVQINPETGAISSPVTLTIENLMDITFSTTGELYGVAGRSDNMNPNTLLGGTIATIDLDTGVVTAQPWNTSKLDYRHKSLAYNSNDGLLYFITPASSGPQHVMMQTIDPLNGNVTTIGTILSVTNVDPASMTYDAVNDVLYWCNSDTLYATKPTGQTTAIDLAQSGMVGIEILPPREQITTFDFSQNGVSLSWDSVQHREYAIYSRANLSTGSWQLVEGFNRIIATPPLNTASGIPLPSSNQGFFKIGAAIDE